MKTLAELQRWLSAAPPGTHVPAASIAELIEAIEANAATPRPTEPRTAEAVQPMSWRERLWTAPAETRIGKNELLEAIGRPRSWLYRHTSRKSGLPIIPHRKLDGELVFVVGEVRAWIRDHEEVVESGPMESPAEERRILKLS